MSTLPAQDGTSRTSVVIPNWNGMRWLDGVLRSIARQTTLPLEVIVVDNGSSDESLAHLQSNWPDVIVDRWPENRGFAAAANAGIAIARGEFIALVNTDIELAPDWIERTSAALRSRPDAGSVATKMVDLDDSGIIYDTGDFLRRDGAAEQRGRFRRDDGRFDTAGEAWAACAGAALYRAKAIRGVGGFDEEFFTYLEDVDLGLRLRQQGWVCVYEPVVAKHAGGGSERALSGGATLWVERNTLLLVAKHFPARWIGPVLYRQVAWAWHHLRAGTILPWLRGLGRGLLLVPPTLARRSKQQAPKLPIDEAVPARPWRGPRAGGHSKSPL